MQFTSLIEIQITSALCALCGGSGGHCLQNKASLTVARDKFHSLCKPPLRPPGFSAGHGLSGFEICTFMPAVLVTVPAVDNISFVL